MLHYEKELIYRDITRLLDKYEPIPDQSNEVGPNDLYDMLLKIHNRWNELTEES